MIHFIFSEKDSRYLFLKYDSPEDEIWLKSSRKAKNPHPNLTDHINLVNPICYLKTYKGPEYTEDFIFSRVNPSGERIYYCSVGLWQDIFKFFRDNNVPYDGLIENQHHLKRKLKHTLEEFKEIVRSWNLSIEPRPYQYEAAYKILQWNRSISELCTRAGKTLIAYMIFRYCIEELGMKRILMIVPSVDLVKQAVSDFSEYKEFFKSEMIWGGGKQVESANFTVGTFQSLIKYLEPKDKKYDPHFFDGYDCVFVDEVHRAKAAQIRSIISQPFMKDVIIGFGMTGTLPQEKTIDHYCLFSLLGAKIQEITSAQLKAAGYISDIEIYQYRIIYNDFELTKKRWFECTEYGIGSYEQVEDLKHPGKKKRVELPEESQNFLLRYAKHMSAGLQTAKQAIYSNPDWSDIRKDCAYMETLKTIVSDSTGSNSLAIERMMVHMFEERIDILVNEILPRCDKNTLILAHHTVYINHICDVIEKKFGMTRNVVKITGSVNSKKRDEIKKQFKAASNNILVASYGCVGTGISLANLCYGVLFESFKSNIINMQAIGRGLGLSELKEKYILYDFVDVFDNDITNKIFLQGLARIKIYQDDKNKHRYHIVKREIGTVDKNLKKEWKEEKKKHKEYTEQQKIANSSSECGLQLTFEFDEFE